MSDNSATTSQSQSNSAVKENISNPKPASLDSQALLKEHFGFDRFKPGQKQVIDHLLAGQSAAAVFPTGGGKSLCYQLPALALDGITLVVSPLIALMKDQIDALAQRGIAAQRIDSSLDYNGYRQAMQQARSGQLRLLYVAPERFNNERFRQVLAQLNVALFAVDEAHCISEWGHNFRPDYLKLAAFAKRAGAGRLLALTATATPKVLEDICKVFEIEKNCAVRTGFYRPNLKLLFTPVESYQRPSLLSRKIKQRPSGSTIVYATTHRSCEKTADFLLQAGLDAKAYHAGMDSAVRTSVQDWFLNSDDSIVVATIAFGMGIDKANIRYIYHYNLPKSLENYAQEIGRAGRDGQEAVCEMLACGDDLKILEDFAYGDTPSKQAIHGLIQTVFNQEEVDFDLSHYYLAKDSGMRPIVATTLLTYLELSGYIEGGTPFYTSYRFQPRMSSQQILACFAGEKKELIANILRCSRRAQTWFYIDIDYTSDKLNMPRGKIITALDFLNEKNMLHLQSEGVRHRYKFLKSPDNIKALVNAMYDRAQQREDSQIKRLNQVVDLVEAGGCQVARLGDHFGEQKEPCGHCSWCLNGNKKAHMPGKRPSKPSS